MDRPAPGVPNASRWRVLLTVLLCVLPGLGHVYARAGRPGVVLLAANLVWAIGVAWGTRLLEPSPAAVAAFVAILLLSLAACTAIAVDAVRRTRTALARPRPAWFRSTWLAAAVALAAATALVPDYGWRSFYIPSASMVPGLLVDDRILVSTIIPAARINRGDVIVFTVAARPHTDYVKRVIGLPGDRVAVRGGTVVLNGTPLLRRPDGDMLVDDGVVRVPARRVIETLPDGRAYPVLQSAQGGPANDMAELQVPPGQFFVLGDNRDNSADSRFPAMLGPVLASNLVGRGGTVFWSPDRSRILTGLR